MQLQRLSRFISYILRHNPDVIDIEMDSHGWVRVDALINGINKTNRSIDFVTLCQIVDNDNKNRFSFNDDKTKIRANQGHSIDVDLELEEIIPPGVLYHGTAEKFLESIMKNGILKKSRKYVHLSSDMDTAVKVGIRHGQVAVLVIDTKKMYKEGFKFYLSKNNVWLTDIVPYKYIIKIER